MDKLISVIVPIYKVEKYLDKCVESIVNQTYKNLEIILVDDGSPDNCPTMCDEWAKKDKRIKVIHKKNGGVSSARNAGLDVISGDFVAFVDSDDYLEFDMYEKLLASQKLNNSEIVLCRPNLVENNHPYKFYEYDLEKFCKFNDLKLLYTYCRIKQRKNQKYIKYNVMGVLWRGIYCVDLFANLRFDEKIVSGEDILIWTQLLKNKNVRMNLVDDYLYNYVMRTSSVTHQYAQENYIESDVNYVNAVSEILNDSPYLSLVCGLKFYKYVWFVIKKIKYNAQIDLKQFESWDTKECYQANKKYTHGFGLKTKVINFLSYHKKYNILKKYYSFKRKIKKLIKHC